MMKALVGAYQHSLDFPDEARLILVGLSAAAVRRVQLHSAKNREWSNTLATISTCACLSRSGVSKALPEI
jgi:hypothetical protein